MPTGRMRSEYEAALHRAHKALHQASWCADALQDYGAAEDIFEMMHHTHKLVEDSIKGKKQPARQVSLLDS